MSDLADEKHSLLIELNGQSLGTCISYCYVKSLQHFKNFQLRHCKKKKKMLRLEVKNIASPPHPL